MIKTGGGCWFEVFLGHACRVPDIWAALSIVGDLASPMQVVGRRRFFRKAGEGVQRWENLCGQHNQGHNASDML